MTYRLFVLGLWGVLALFSAPTASTAGLTNDDVIGMSRAGLGDTPILEKIKSSGCSFDTSVGNLSLLKKSGLSDVVITAMIACRSTTVDSNSPLDATQAKASVAGNLSSELKAHVYVYRYKQFTGAALEPSVFCDEVELARMDNGRYFAAVLEPGQHTFRSNDKQSGVQMDLKPGQDYHLRIEIATGFWKGHGRLVAVPKEQGAFELAKLRPLDSDKIKDRQHVIAPESLSH